MKIEEVAEEKAEGGEKGGKRWRNDGGNGGRWYRVRWRDGGDS